MSRLKFDAKMEYEYLDNMKVLQKAFTKHRIDKVGET
jgi:RP/EB family microtubule-associated protein